MELPRLLGRGGMQDIVIPFLGYNCTDTGGRGEFVYTENLSSDYFPHIGPRKPRESVKAMGKGNGLLAREEKLFYVDGTAAYYDGVQVGTVTDSKKELLNYGAYILIFPDKKYYQTVTKEFGSLEHTFISSGQVRYEQSHLTETKLDGTGQPYTKIYATGIDRGFEKGDGVTISGSTIKELNKTTVIQDKGDGWILVIQPIQSNTSQSAAITIKREVPDMDFHVVSANRLWGCSSKNHEVYASKLGSPQNFHVLQTVASDSWAATIANDGDFTGAVCFLGYVMFFKENSLYKIYGNNPRNFQIVESQLRGVEKGAEKSLCIVNEVLYYKAKDGIMSFQGAMPFEVGTKIGNGYHGGAAGTKGNKYYISMEKEGKHHFFVYDTVRDLWHREDNEKALSFARGGNDLYYLTDRELKKIDGTSGGQLIPWECITTDFDYQNADSKYVQRISLRASVSNRSYMEVWIQYDTNEVWERVAGIGGTGKNTVTLPIIPKRSDHFKIKIKGQGNVKVYDMTLWIFTGSEKRRR